MLVTDFSPCLKNGVLDLNEAGYKFSCGKGGKKFTDTFDVRKLAEFIKNTDNIITEFNAAMWGIGELPIDKFRSLMDAIKDSNITALNFENNTLSPEMVDEISKLTKLNLGFSNIGNEGIVKIVGNLSNLKDFDARGNYITDEGVDAMINTFPKLEVCKIGYGNNISCAGLKKMATALIETLTEFHIYSSAYSNREMLDVVTLLPAGVVKTGVNDNAPLPLVEVVEGDNNAPPLVGVVENLEGE